MESGRSDKKMAPFLNKTIRATHEELDFLKFIRDNYFLPEITGGYQIFLFDKMKALIDQKNVLISQGKSGKELEDIIFRIANVELYMAKWDSMIKRYENQD